MCSNILSPTSLVDERERRIAVAGRFMVQVLFFLFFFWRKAIENERIIAGVYFILIGFPTKLANSTKKTKIEYIK